MQDKDKQDLITELEKLTIGELINKIKRGEATASHLAVARGILNDNKMLLLMDGDENSPLNRLVEALPFTTEPEGPSASHG